MNGSSSTSVRPGALPFTVGSGPIGLVVIHGLGGSPFEYRAFGDLFDTQKFTVFGPRLAGHGINLPSLAASRPEDWLASVDQAVQGAAVRCEHIILIGVSYGAILALQTAKSHPNITGLILVNPALSYRGGGQFQDALLAIIKPFAKNIRKPGLSPTDLERYQMTGSMPGWPIQTLQSSKKYLRHVVMPTLGDIHQPILVLSSGHDQYVDTTATQRVFQAANIPAEFDHIPSLGHRPFRDPAVLPWLVERCRRFVAVF